MECEACLEEMGRSVLRLADAVRRAARRRSSETRYSVQADLFDTAKTAFLRGRCKRTACKVRRGE